MIVHSDRIVIWGQSCVGKTTFAKLLIDHHYYCFDALFHWHVIEAFGLSIEDNLRVIYKSCNDEKFVLDGWHLADPEGKWMPEGSCVYVLYADYAKIIEQYRIAVDDPQEFHPMFRKWYHEPTLQFAEVRFFENTGTFEERTRRDYFTWLARNQ